MRKEALIFSCGLLLLLTLFAPDAAAQSRRNRRGGTVYGQRVEKAIVLPDSLELARRDSLRQVDSLHREDSIALLSKSSLELPAFSNAALYSAIEPRGETPARMRSSLRVAAESAIR